MSRKWLIGLVLVLAAALVLCLIDRARNGTVKINITQGMINSALARHFPTEKTYLKVVRVSYVNPRAVLLPDLDKVLVSLEVQVTVGISGFERTYTGGASLITRVGYKPADQRFYLTDSELQTLDIPKIPEDYRNTLREGLNVLAKEFIDEVPIYKLSKNDTSTNLAKLLLKDVSIRKDKVVVTLGP